MKSGYDTNFCDGESSDGDGEKVENDDNSSTISTLGGLRTPQTLASLQTNRVAISHLPISLTMEFWGVEVKPGEPFKVQPKYGYLIHISQASLGEVKDVKEAKRVSLRLKVDNKDFVIGSLSAEDRPQVMFDLVFEKQFELSHDLKQGSVYFMGYIAEEPISDSDDLSSDDSEDVSEDEQLENQDNGDVKPKTEDVKAANSAAAATNEAKAEKAAPEPVKEEENPDSDDSEDDSDAADDDEMASSDDESGEDSDEEEDDSSDEEEEEPTPKQSKKRPAEQAPVIATKKAKASTPDKTGKKGQNATLLPTKPAAATKAPAGKAPNKSKQSPKAGGGQFSGKSGNKFNSKNGKGKRGGK
ncbi:Histone deacetylase HDT1 [Striga hermonthica]|uniref:Histone deacetylase HDT1 n=1 Tax=Striga hermonthica TaxID=68872 RepID=A0A9N7R7C1_STRHE|nr:Histone deacetylase HDT1 [Striga hermonthica]